MSEIIYYYLEIQISIQNYFPEGFKIILVLFKERHILLKHNMLNVSFKVSFFYIKKT